jgi:hypothetical protein
MYRRQGVVRALSWLSLSRHSNFNHRSGSLNLNMRASSALETIQPAQKADKIRKQPFVDIQHADPDQLVQVTVGSALLTI